MHTATALLIRLRRRSQLDFSDYLELRHLRDAGHAAPGTEEVVAHLERALPVAFVGAIPDLATLADAREPPPRGLTREALRVAFAMRNEFAAHGIARAGLMGFDLPEGEGLKDWLDLMENERKHALSIRASLRKLDRRIWTLYTGERRMPTAPPLGP